MANYVEKNSHNLLTGMLDPDGDTVTVRRINGSVVNSWPHVVPLSHGTASITEAGIVIYDDGGDASGHPSGGSSQPNGSFTFRLWDGIDESPTYSANIQLDGLGGGGLTTVSSVSSISGDKGVTWNFSTPVDAGQFANGDWFIIRPSGGVNLVSTSPASSGGQNGLMRNFTTATNDSKNTQQGFTSSVSGPSYSSSLNVDPGNAGSLSLNVGDCLIKAVTSGGIQEYRTLTVLDAVPPAESFRPPTHGTTRSVQFTVADLDLSQLQSFAPVAGIQNPSTVRTTYNFDTVQQLFWEGSEQTRNISPSNGIWNYGTDMGHILGKAILSLHCNYSWAEKKALVIDIVQAGIDVLGHVQTVGTSSYDTTFKSNAGLPGSTPGRVYKGAGGNNAGPEFFGMFAAVMLNDSGLNQLVGSNAYDRWWNVNDCYDYVDQSADVNRTLKVIGGPDSWRGRTYHYESGHVGMPDWNIQHKGPVGLSWEGPDNDNANPAKNYHGIALKSSFGAGFGIMLMPNGPTICDVPAFYDCVDRWGYKLTPVEYAGANGSLINATIDKDNTADPVAVTAFAAWRSSASRPLWGGKPEVIYPPIVNGGGSSLTVNRPTTVDNGASITQWDVRFRGTGTSFFGANGDVYSRSEDQDGAGGWSVVNGISWNGSNQYTISGLGSGTYRVQVRARNAHGTGPWSTNNLKITQDSGAARAVASV